MDQEERKFLELLLEKDWVPFEKLRRFVAMVDEFKAIGVKTSLRELLLARGILTKEQADAIEKEVKQSPQIRLPQIPSPHLGATKTSSITLLKSVDLCGSSPFEEILEDTNVEDPLLLEPIETPMGLEVGEVIDKYKVLGEIGKGGMATIYEVWDQELRRTLAMKVFTLKKKTKKSIARFVSEAQATAQLQHPNIISIHDIGWTPAKLPYFTMDIVRGHALESVINHLALGDPDISRVYPQIRLVQIFIKICEGLSYAHSKGVIHRDLKPQNVMVGPFGEVYLMDWGLAKFLKSTSSGVWTERQEEAWVTQQGAVVGTPTYMAPEQARGEVENIDERTDVYALGAILYEMLAFRSPFLSETIEETYHKVLHAPAPDPREVALGAPPPAPLCAIVIKALSKDKAHRYPNVAAMKQDVQKYLDEEEIDALPDNIFQKSWRWLQRSPWAVAIALLVCCIFLLFWKGLFSSGGADRPGLRKIAQAWKLTALEGSSARVEKNFQEALDQGSSSEKVWILTERARYYLHRNQLEKAEKDLDGRAKLKAETTEEFFLRFCISEYRGNGKKAKKWLRKISKGKGAYRDFARGWLSFLENPESPQKALKGLRAVLKRESFQDPLWAHLCLAQVYADQGRYALSMAQDEKKFFQQAEDEFDQGKKLFLKEAIFYITQAKYYLLRYEYLKKFSLHTNDLQRDEFFNTAIAQLNFVLKLMPENGYFYFVKGRAFYLKGDRDMARSLFAVARRKSPQGEWVPEMESLLKGE